MTDRPLRLFVPPDSVVGGQLTLHGPDAEQAYRRGARMGKTLIALDDSGWELAVHLAEARPDLCHGEVTGRALAAERRTKISLFQGLLHPSDFRRLLQQATAVGVVAFNPVIADGSVVPAPSPDGTVEGEAEWPRLVCDAAEDSGRGRRPTIGQPMLFDHAVDQATRSGTVLLLHSDGPRLEAALAGRPFSIDLFCPPPGGFSPEERTRAVARGVAVVAPSAVGADPIRPALATLDTIYAQLEEA